jgi:hypothetical protein
MVKIPDRMRDTILPGGIRRVKVLRSEEEKLIHLSYGDARRSLGDRIANHIWTKFPSTKTEAVLTNVEFKRLVALGFHQESIDAIIERSTG